MERVARLALFPVTTEVNDQGHLAIGVKKRPMTFTWAMWFEKAVTF
jgi:hypothetical protein